MNRNVALGSDLRFRKKSRSDFIAEYVKRLIHPGEVRM